MGGGSITLGGRCRGGPDPGAAGPPVATGGRRGEVDKGPSVASRALANRVLPIVLGLSVGKAPGDLLLTTERGSQLHRSAVLRSLEWSTTGRGRRIHDLRHTAACLWLARGVDPGTVPAWMGHESIGTTNRYLHFLGTGADLAGLARLNVTSGDSGGTHRQEAGG